VDIGEVAAQQFVEKYIFSLLPLINKTPIKSYKTMVQEYIQKDLKITPEYQEQEFEKDQKGNILQYTSSLFIQGEKKSEGKGTNKKKAQEAAAKNFYESLEETIS
jgi:ribonuclease-3